MVCPFRFTMRNNINCNLLSEIKCPTIFRFNDLEIDNQERAYKSLVNVSCAFDSNRTLSDGRPWSMSVCDVTGTWVPDIPECIG